MFKKLSLALVVATAALAGCSPEPISEGNSSEGNSSEVNASKAQPATESVQVTKAQYQEGVHYRLVKNIDSEGAKAPFIVEYFWLGCPHCQAFEAPLKSFIRNNPNFSVLKKPAAANSRWALDAQIYYGLKEINKLEHLDGLFEQYRGKSLPTKTDISDFLASVDIEPTEFFEMMAASQTISNRLKQNVAEMQENDLRGVPGIVVNGKYLVLTVKGVDFFEVVKYLADK